MQTVRGQVQVQVCFRRENERTLSLGFTQCAAARRERTNIVSAEPSKQREEEKVEFGKQLHYFCTNESSHIPDCIRLRNEMPGGKDLGHFRARPMAYIADGKDRERPIHFPERNGE